MTDFKGMDAIPSVEFGFGMRGRSKSIMRSERSEESLQRKERLRFLFRERDGEPRRARLRQFLEGVPDDLWHFIPLDESDPLIYQLFSTASEARDNEQLRARPELSRESFEAEFRRLLMLRPADETVLVALSHVNDTGLIECRLEILFPRAVEIIDFDRNSLVLSPTSFAWGIVAQRFEIGDDMVEYLVESWGL